MSTTGPASNNRVAFREYPDTGALARAAAEYWLDRFAAAPPTRDRWCIALSGGRIATQLYNNVVALSLSRRFSWEKAEFFFADDRWVPLDDEASNYRMAHEGLFGPLKIADKTAHPIYRGHTPAYDAAQAQADLLRHTPINAAGDPMLDLVILGMGEDGHVASLFPAAPPEVSESRTVYVAVIAPKPPPQRITLTYAALAAARDVLVLVSGPGKESALRESLNANPQRPLGRLIGLRQRTTVFADFRLSLF